MHGRKIFKGSQIGELRSADVNHFHGLSLTQHLIHADKKLDGNTPLCD